LIKLINKRNIKVNFLEKDKLKSISFINNINHQNIIAIVKKTSYLSLNTFIENFVVKKDSTINLLILNKVQDPQNLGSIIRTAVCFDVKAIILPKKNAVKITPIVKKNFMRGVLTNIFCRSLKPCGCCQKIKKIWIFIYSYYRKRRKRHKAFKYM